MKKLFFTLLCLGLFTFSCRKKSYDTQAVAEKQEEYLQKDSLAFSYFQQLIQMDKQGFKVEIEPHQNAHVKNQVDSLRTYTFNNTLIRIYQTPDKALLESAIIKDVKLQFSDGMKIGLNKAQVSKILGVPIKGQQLKIGDMEQNIVFEFKFANDQLKEIEYLGYVD